MYVQIPATDCLNLTAPLVERPAIDYCLHSFFNPNRHCAPLLVMCTLPPESYLTSESMSVELSSYSAASLPTPKDEYYRIKRSFAGTEVYTYQLEAFLSWTRDLERRGHQLDNEPGQTTVLGTLGHMQAVKRLTAETQLWRDEWDERREVHKRQILALDAELAQSRLRLKKTQEENARQRLLKETTDETITSLRKTFPTADARTLGRCLARYAAFVAHTSSRTLTTGTARFVSSS
jgi:hypothetical protein